MSIETGRRTEGLDLELIRDQWGQANVAFALLVAKLDYEGTAKYLTQFVSPEDLTLEGYQRSVHLEAFRNPDDENIQAASIISTSLLTCAQVSRAIDALIPHRAHPIINDAIAERLFKQDLIRSLYMVDQTVAELRAIRQAGPFSKLANVKLEV